MPDTGWTHVRRKTRCRPKHDSHGQAQPQPPNPRPSETFTPRTTNLRPVSALEGDYAKFHKQWLESPCRASLIRIIHEHTHTHAHTHAHTQSASSGITNAVCLGIGTFDPEDGGWETKRSAYMQLCAFTTLVSELENITKSSIKCIHQEPILTSSDKTFLSNLGHEIVDSPRVYASITDTTLLFGIHLYRPIYALALQKCTPAIFVGTGWDVWDEVTMEKSDDLKNLEIMENTHLKAAFPQDPSSTAFSSTFIYFRPRSSDERNDSRDAKEAEDEPEQEKDEPRESPVQDTQEASDAKDSTDSNSNNTTDRPIQEPQSQDSRAVPPATTKHATSTVKHKTDTPQQS